MIISKQNKLKYIDSASEWVNKNLLLITVIILGPILTYLYFRGFERMFERWNSPEYSFGYFIPFISLYLIRRKKEQVLNVISNSITPGMVVLIFGLCVYILGELSTISVIVQYSFLLTLYGIAIILFGWKAVKVIIFPLAFLFLMIPLPEFLYNRLSSELQLISSQFGVFLLRLISVSVYLEGNVVDLGSYKLQVVEACSGLKYLFSLFTISILLAYLYNGKLWVKFVIFALALPITILMNSIRIAVTGLLVEHWGTGVASGFFHQFEGLVIFASALFILLLCITLLNRFFGQNKTLKQAFQDIDQSDSVSKFSTTPVSNKQSFYRPYMLVLIVMLIAISFKLFHDKREIVLPNRSQFINFPQTIGIWKGHKQGMQSGYIDQLKFDDYILSRYTNKENSSNVVLYVAYYKTQKQGESAHSPKSCLPGGGWQVSQISQVPISLKNLETSLNINRVLIKKGRRTQLVYYWFKQRGRSITNEYSVKWYLFLDALRYNRTDGALIRISTSILPGETVQEGDTRLKNFTGTVASVLGQYVPD